MSHRGGRGQALAQPAVPLQRAAGPAHSHVIGSASRSVDTAWSWEDPATLVAALQPTLAGDVLVAAGAGDDPLTLLIAGAGRVIAATPHPGQLGLAEVKMVCARTLPLERLHAALGLSPSSARYAMLWAAGQRGGLSEHGRAWLEARETDLHAGVLACGHAEAAATRLRAELARSIRAGTMARLLGELDGDARARRLARVTGGRWRISFRLTMGDALLGVPASLIRQRVEAAITRGPDFQVLWLLSGRCVDTEDAHPYLSRAGHASLASCGALELVQTDLVTALAAARPGSLGAVSLGLAEALPVSLSVALHAAARALRPGGRLLMRSTGPITPLGRGFVVELDQTRRLLALDRCLASLGLVVARRI